MNYWEHKLVRDPLYGFIGLTGKEDELLSTLALQRLSRIKQLAHTYIVFPSAVQTRLEHSLGTVYTAGRMCDQLELRTKEKRIVRLAGLIHDVGHGPFSHLFEDVMRHVNGETFNHEDVTKLFLEYDRAIRRVLGPAYKDVLEIFDGDSLASDIISSSLDADKMDYLRRDAYHTGVTYGIYDFERVVRSICKVPEFDRDYIAIHEKGKDALESYRLARYSMHAQVYEHHARLIADDMFLRAVIKAIDNGSFPKEYLNVSEPEKFLSKYVELDDSSIEHLVLEKGRASARQLMEDIRARRLLKRAYIVPLTKDGVPNPIQRERLITMDKHAVERTEETIASEVGLDPSYVIVHLQSINIKLYERFEQSIGKKDKPILVQKRDGSLAYLDEESPISASMDPIRRLFVFCPKKHTQRVKQIAENIFRAKSIY